MIDFPNSPTVGQQFTAAGANWVWDGVKWTVTGLAGQPFLPLSGGTLTGPLTLNANPTGNLGAATKQYVDASVPLPAGGFVNKFRNAAMDIWQRGNSIVAANGNWLYTADGWIVNVNGAGTTVGPGSSLGSTLNSLVVNGVAGITSCNIGQRIESYLGKELAGKRVTVQFRVSNNTGAAITPGLATSYPNATDNWPGGSTTDLTTVNLQPVPSSASPPTGSVVCAYTFDVSPNAANGYYIQLVCNAPIPSGWFAMSEADVRVTPGWPVGLCTNPPVPELRAVSTEMLSSQRYYEAGSNQVWGGYVAGTGTNGYLTTRFTTTKRATPTISMQDVTSNSFPAGSPSTNGVWADNFMSYKQSNAAGPANGWFQFNWQASAEL